MRIRITIEYDPDAPEGQDRDVTLINEKKDWLDGNVNIYDIEDMQEHDPIAAKVKWEILP